MSRRCVEYLAAYLAGEFLKAAYMHSPWAVHMPSNELALLD